MSDGVNYGREKLRNIFQQVAKNKCDIEKIYQETRLLGQFGIRVVLAVKQDSEVPFPYEGDYGDAVAVGIESPFKLYVWTRADGSEHEEDYWFALGYFPAVGPQGPKGDKGDTGENGVGSRWWLGTKETPQFYGQENDCYLNVTTGEIKQVISSEWKTQGNIRGPQGPQGPQGEKGPQGGIGVTGPRGYTGQSGRMINLIGTVATSEDLPSAADIDNTTAYITRDNNHIYVVIGEAPNKAWYDLGVLNDVAIASDTQLGVVKAGDTWSSQATVPVRINPVDGKMYVAATDTNIIPASDDLLGGMKTGFVTYSQGLPIMLSLDNRGFALIQALSLDDSLTEGDLDDSTIEVLLRPYTILKWQNKQFRQCFSKTSENILAYDSHGSNGRKYIILIDTNEKTWQAIDESERIINVTASKSVSGITVPDLTAEEVQSIYDNKLDSINTMIKFSGSVLSVHQVQLSGSTIYIDFIYLNSYIVSYALANGSVTCELIPINNSFIDINSRIKFVKSFEGNSQTQSLEYDFGRIFDNGVLQQQDRNKYLFIAFPVGTNKTIEVSTYWDTYYNCWAVTQHKIASGPVTFKVRYLLIQFQE